jgi:hypothetical protein
LCETVDFLVMHRMRDKQKGDQKPSVGGEG